jgi:hypothetical protein
MEAAVRLVDINTVLDRNGGVAKGTRTDEAWVMDPRARRDDPASFDMTGFKNGDGETRIRPYLVAMPGSLDELELRLARHRAADAPGAVRICPGLDGHGYPLEPWALSPIPEYCEREDLALVIDVASPLEYPWADLVRFARGYPRLTIVALGAPLGGPTARRALDSAPNLLLETSALAGDGSCLFADLVNAIGAYRFVYGSGASRANQSAVVAALSEADAQVVFSGTAHQLANGTWGVTYL